MAILNLQKSKDLTVELARDSDSEGGSLTHSFTAAARQGPGRGARRT